ncbi:MAG: DUF6465 family protein [Bacillota bacterium]|nr:DUF6465 family protein [Bacillota bacterium]
MALTKSKSDKTPKSTAKPTVTKAATTQLSATKATSVKPTEKVEFYVEFAGKQISSTDIIANAKAAYTAESSKNDIKSLKIYANTDQSAAYFVVNDDEARKINL